MWRTAQIGRTKKGALLCVPFLWLLISFFSCGAFGEEISCNIRDYIFKFQNGSLFYAHIERDKTGIVQYQGNTKINEYKWSESIPGCIMIQMFSGSGESFYKIKRSDDGNRKGNK